MPALSEDPELEAHVRARLGTTLKDKYRLDSVLGIGGMAAVYGATHRNGRQVAVKLLHPHLSTNSDARARFQREGLVANKVRHPGVVAVLDDDVTQDGAAFLVMELLEGSTLEDLWEQHGQRLPLPAVMAVGVAVLDVLAAAHAAGVVHRDIKPANLFLTSHWQIKVLDFGISRLQNMPSATQTQTGMMLGSPAFMAPEQALGRIQEIDARTDLWAAAAALFTLASGAYVHEAPSAQEMLIRAATTPIRSLGVALPGVPGLISAVIDRALAFRREERWGSAAEMSVALAEASRASFGEEPSMGAFASVLAFVPPEMAARPPYVSSAYISSFPPPAATQLTSSTSQLVRPPPAGLAGTKRAVVVGAVAAIGLVVGFAFVASRFARSSASSEPAAGIVQQPLQTTAAADPRSAGIPPAPPVASAATSAFDDVPPLSAPASAPASAKAAPVARTAPGQKSGGPKVGAPTGTKPPSTFLPSATSAAAPPDPCNPPYRFDFFGNKVTKPGC